MLDTSRLFDSGAETYDRARARLVPDLTPFYETAVDIAAGAARDPAVRILDLGAGTGLMTAELAALLPDASYTLLDSSPGMLAIARRELALYAVRHEIVEADMRGPLPAGPFDLVVSALAIHHLPHEDQRALYPRIREVLAEGGAFVHAEQVAGPTARLDTLYDDMWSRDVARRNASDGELAEARARMAYDRSVPVRTHLEWLAEAGFREADCFYKRYRFAVLGAWV
ncbi:class I SAM-dependent methyltransferase [Kitasatospora sp. NPDC089797]|uniref:class I SAM-dependent methyltransferase n=1 Tax=Kitasatospora sp. NPDC089797 TaxID=3155298 RepID=UPI003438F744